MSFNLLEPSGPVQACNGMALPFILLINLRNKGHTKCDIQRTVHRDIFL
jgi:hypothetical protein